MKTPHAAGVVMTVMCLAACKNRQHRTAPLPPEVTVAPVVRQKITRFLDTTGSAAVPLMARGPQNMRARF